MTTLHADSWEQYAALAEAEIERKDAENERLRAALKEISEGVDLGGAWLAAIAGRALSASGSSTPS